jgi:hypothetical protein
MSPEEFSLFLFLFLFFLPMVTVWAVAAWRDYPKDHQVRSVLIETGNVLFTFCAIVGMMISIVTISSVSLTWLHTAGWIAATALMIWAVKPTLLRC